MSSGGVIMCSMNHNDILFSLLLLLLMHVSLLAHAAMLLCECGIVQCWRTISPSP